MDGKPPITYTQTVDEKTGEIKYVPTTPPEGATGATLQQPPKDAKKVDKKLSSGKVPKQEYLNAFNVIRETGNFNLDDKLTSVLKQIEDNNRKLRYDRRLTGGKLDGRRLTAYKTSDRLFKKKAIKHKNYQFAIMLDTSGSMFATDDNYNADNFKDQIEHSKLKLSVEAVIQTVKSIEELGMDVTVVAMNQAVHLLKPYGEKLDMEFFMERLFENVCGDYDGDDYVGGTSEYIAYTETLKYMTANRKPKQVPVVFVLSDGEPGSGTAYTPVVMADDDIANPRKVENDRNVNEWQSLKSFWQRKPDILTYGIGIMSNCKQVPNSRRLDTIDQLPLFMGQLLQTILL